MAKAIFHREFHFTSRKVNAGWSVKPGPKPQTFPRELIDAAVSAGVAKEVEAKVSGSEIKLDAEAALIGLSALVSLPAADN